MSKINSQQNQLLYEDENVKISADSVTVLKFYFPQDTKNQILFKDINKLALREMDPMDETLGVDPSFFQNYKKKIQQNKNLYIQIAVQDQSARLSFAPQNPNKVFKIIQKRWEDTKIQMQKKSTQPLQQINLYNNVQVTKESIEKAIQHLKKSQEPKKDSDSQNQKKRLSPSPNKKGESQAGQNPKKKIKESTKVEVNEQNITNPSICSYVV